eukprot:TRINITY_DN2502_c0_g1_i28.p1 TRINITY_DN2502_c0_g1~~TRINITY_DN2502_c0_g1_i28.p1  ORF type:complete len:393 (-),score=53.93 TRINITY_DN2502_c0_g1_i28:427-1605(-)
MFSVSKIRSIKRFSTQIQQQNVQTGHHDIIIVGSGMAGAGLAASLAVSPLSKHKRICVIDSVPAKGLPQVMPAIPDLRVFSINLGSIDLFKAIGVWERMTAARSTPYYDMRVWDKQSYGSISFSHKDTEAPFLGHIMELGVIQGALVDRLKEFENVQLLCPEKILKIEFPPETHPGELVTVTTTKNGKLKTRLLVGADGANSFVRTEAGIGLSTVGYNQRGVVATLETTEPHSTAWQRFLPTGPIALLPLHDNYSSIVWSTNPYQAETLLDHTDQQFLDGINFAFNSPPSYRYTTGFLSSSLDKVICDFLGERKDSHMPLPKITKLVGPRAAFPLRMSHAQNYVRPRLALIGDAGHTVHPLAGQGINLGFADVITLTRIIQEAIESGSDIGR